MVGRRLLVLLVYIAHIWNAQGWKKLFQQPTGSSLRLVHVLFRHGERTPDSTSVYPNDPYANETYFPVGLGQLTKKGKRTEYAIGEALRKRYDTFLGQQYFPGILDAYTSEIDRTKASLQLVLASLFPPSPEETFVKGLRWQPIPYTNLGLSEVLWGSLICEEYNALYEQYLLSKEGISDSLQFLDLLNYVSENAGWNITIRKINELYSVLKAEENWGLELPEWTDPVWPANISEAAGQSFYSDMGTKEMQTYAVGYLLQQILNDTSLKINGSSGEQKLVLYSGHDVNVAYLLIALGAFKPKVPPYGSYVIIEVHEIDEEYYIKVLHQDYSSREPRTITIENCEEYCSFKQFSDLMADILPSPAQECNKINLSL